MTRFISLFSGIGGFDLGFEQAGMTCVLQVENDRAALDVLQRRWPNVPKIKDVKDVNRNNAPTTDLICGGFPCQDLSVAGKREGLAGERSGLWFEFHRIIKELKPRWVVIENVPGLLSASGGRDFATILSGLAECGYYAAWRVLDAQYFGLAQRRRRVFIVASLGNGSCAQVLFESEGGAWDSPPGREAGEGFAAAITERTRDAGRQLEMQDDLAYALTNPGSGGRPHSRLVAFSESGPGWWRDGIGTLRERDYKDGNTGLICNTFNGYTGGADDNDAQGWHDVPALTSNGDAHSGLRDENGLIMAFDLHNNSKSVSPTLQAGSKAGGKNEINHPTVYGQFGVRRLTPVECERLQGFPDGFTDGQSDSQRYRQLGNAVAVPCAEWLGGRIKRMAQ